MTKGLFITGTDTGVGKTLVARALLHAATAAGLRAVGMKPVAAGCRETDMGLRNDDAEALLAAGNINAPYEDVNPVALPLATSPEIAARAAGLDIGIPEIAAAFQRLAGSADCVIVEGAGGWYAPLAPGMTIADVAIALKLPVVLVVPLRLGCLNHMRLSMEAIARSGLPLAAIVTCTVSPNAALPGYTDSIETLAGAAPTILLPHYAADNMHDAAARVASILIRDSHKF
jgi:dethiobiotin synthetase